MFVSVFNASITFVWLMCLISTASLKSWSGHHYRRTRLHSSNSIANHMQQRAYFDPATGQITVKEVLVGESSTDRPATLEEEIPDDLTVEEIKQLISGQKLSRPKAVQTNNPVKTGMATVEQLRTWWMENAARFGRSLDDFSIPDAIALLESSSTMDIMKDRFEEGERASTAAEKKEATIVVTEEELQRLWRDRRNLLFAPSQEEFTLPAALLLVDDDDDEDDEAATITSENIDPREDYLDKEAHHARIGRERNVLLEAFEEKVRQQPQLLDDPLARVIDPMTERELLDINVFWRDWPEGKRRVLKEKVQRLTDSIDRNQVDQSIEETRGSVITPDIYKQGFDGNIMYSNPHQTSSLIKEMGISTQHGGSMQDDALKDYPFLNYLSAPGEPLENFQDDRPMWVKYPPLQELTRELDEAGGSLLDRLIEEGKLSRENLTTREKILSDMQASHIREQARLPVELPSALPDDNHVDHPSHAADGGDDCGDDSLGDDKMVNDQRQVGSSMEKAKEIMAKMLEDNSALMDLLYSKEEQKELLGYKNYRIEHGQDDDDEYLNLTGDKRFDRESEAHDDLELYIQTRFANSPEYADFVGVETWKQWENYDDELWDDDRKVLECSKYVMNMTDLYLRDHFKAMENIHRQRGIQRYLDAIFASNNDERKNISFPVMEAIPKYLTPDKERGVEYSNEVIEMKSKISLHPKPPDFKALFANDTFGPNIDQSVINPVGTIRSQYDWTPREDLLPHRIDAEQMDALKPLLQFMSGVGTLQSTKDNILVFDYHGPIRSIIGMRSLLLGLAKKCIPEVLDLRLETTRKRDVLR